MNEPTNPPTETPTATTLRVVLAQTPADTLVLLDGEPVPLVSRLALMVDASDKHAPRLTLTRWVRGTVDHNSVITGERESVEFDATTHRVELEGVVELIEATARESLVSRNMGALHTFMILADGDTRARTLSEWILDAERYRAVRRAADAGHVTIDTSGMIDADGRTAWAAEDLDTIVDELRAVPS